MEIPNPKTIRELRIENEFEFLRLYRGVSLDQRSFLPARSDVDTIFLYRRPIIGFWCEFGDSLVALIQNFLLHKTGQYFGLSDADIRAIEFSAKVEGDTP